MSAVAPNVSVKDFGKTVVRATFNKNWAHQSYDDEPSVVVKKSDGSVKMRRWDTGSSRGRENGPCEERFHSNGQLDYRIFKVPGVGYHRTDGPACVQFDKDGNCAREEFWENGKFLRGWMLCWSCPSKEMTMENATRVELDEGAHLY